jgi:hypothetical protein
MQAESIAIWGRSQVQSERFLLHINWANQVFIIASLLWYKVPAQGRLKEVCLRAGPIGNIPLGTQLIASGEPAIG